MGKEEYVKKLKKLLEEAPFIIVGVGGIEGEEVCKLLKKENKKFTAYKSENLFWQNMPSEVHEKVTDALNSGKKVLSFCIVGDLPEGILSVASYWHEGDNKFSPVEQLSLALTGDVSPYYKLISANGKGYIWAMREEAAELLKSFLSLGKYKKILKDAGITNDELRDYKQKFYDSGEVGMEKIPESFRAGIGLVIKNIRKRDRYLQGINEEQEVQAERAVMDSYLIGSVTVVDIEDLKPAAIFDRLVEAEIYGLLMLSDESVFIGPWSKVKKFEKHFSEGKIEGESPRGIWKGSYSRPLILDFVKTIEKVKDRKTHQKEEVFMKL